MFREVPDVSNLCQFQFYERYYYQDRMTKFPHLTELLGRVLCPSEDYGNEKCQWIMRADRRVFPRQTLQKLRLRKFPIH